MRMKLSLIASLLVVGLLFPATAGATDDCTISGTGPGSTNECVVRDTCEIDVDNDTDIDIINDSEQEGTSGNAGSTGNTTGGGAASGDTSNQNQTEVEVGVENGGASCEEAMAPPVGGGGAVTPTPGRGAGQVQGAATEVGGRGAGEAQVVAPVGGVGAGNGGAAVPILTASAASLLLGVTRLRKLSDV